MIDNKKLTKFVKEQLRETNYQVMVEIYDKHCAGCEFKSIELAQGNGKVVGEYTSLFDAIVDAQTFDLRILRGCNFGGNKYTLNEIISNTCRLWKESSCESDEGEFIEVEEFKIGDLIKYVEGSKGDNNKVIP